MRTVLVRSLNEGTSLNFLGIERNLVLNLHGEINYEKHSS